MQIYTLFLKLKQQTCIYLSSRQVIWHRILMICYVRDPVITVHVGYVENVECIDAHPDVAESTAYPCIDVPVLVLEQAVTDAQIDTAVTGHAEHLLFAACMGRTEG